MSHKPVEPIPIQNPLAKTLILGTATGLGLGYGPVAPGTFGSLLGIPLGLWLLQYPTWMALVICGILLIPFSLVSNRAGFHFGNRDSGKIVIDEVLGQALTLLGMKSIVLELKPALAAQEVGVILESANFSGFFDLLGLISHNTSALVYILCGFAFFRALDITKPFPARRFDRQGNGFGVMMDDVVAGLYGAIILRALIKIFG